MSTENTNTNLPVNISNLPDLLQRGYEEQAKRGPVDMQRLQEASLGVRQLEHGYHAMIPLECKGSACPMVKKCPLWQAGLTYMVGKPCPLEQHLMTTYTNKIISSLNIDPTNYTETSIAIELAKIDIYELRISNRIAYEDFVKEQAISISDDGEPLYREELHQAVVWDDMLSKRKLKYLDAILATRKARATAGAGNSTDPSTNAAAVKRLLERKTLELNITAEQLRAEGAKNITPKV